ncbi:MAG TPA: Calx-beta domain-containing protein [Thermoanaerobaculia bacterium]|nr:Calx-beta domain-containing protein [Thermoanaerobaculia bacterium]
MQSTHKLALTALLLALLVLPAALAGAQGNDPPGLLVLSSNTASVNEGGTVTFVVQRVGGDDNAVSVQYSTGGGTATAGVDYAATSGTLTWPDNDDDPRFFTVQTFEDSIDESNETVTVSLSNPGGGASLGSPSSATLTINDDDTGTGGGACVEDQFTLCLLDNRFRVQVDFRPPGGQLQAATRIPFTNRAGLFWFFNAENVEMLVKMQDACGPFNRFWVFVAATTNVEYLVRVVDTQTSQQMQYFNPQGMAASPVQDTQAFATCP